MSINEKFRLYFENAPIGIFVANQKGQYTEANPAECRITGYSESELIAMPLVDIIHPEDRQKAVTHFSSVATAGKASGSLRFLRKNNSVGVWQVEAIKLGDNKLIGFATDITESINIKNQLLDSDEWYQELF